MKKYIVRFKEGIEIKTIKFCDYESLKYFVGMLEQKDIEFVVIKNLNNRVDFTLKCLLDYEEEK
jgi:hypothetical protein